MTIVRSLLTRIGFEVDRRGLDNVDRAVQGFKRRIVFTGRDLKDFAFEAAGFLGEISRANVDVAELARNTNTSVERFVALREAARQFRFDPGQFDHTFSRLSELLREAKTGYGEVYEIARKSYGQLNLVPFAQTGDVEGALNAVLRYVESIDKASDQVAILRDVIGGGAENSLIRVIEGGIDKFNEAADANRNFGKSFADSLPDQKKYLENLSKLEKQYEQLKQTAAAVLAPAATVGLNFVDTGLKGIQFLRDKSENEGKEEARSFVGQAIADSVYRLFGYEPLVDVQNKVYEDDIEFQRRLFQEYQRIQQQKTQPTTVNNTIDVNVAAGTPEEQRVQIAEAVRDEIEAFYDEKNREVISNNPQVE